jgi:hypothetical protein
VIGWHPDIAEAWVARPPKGSLLVIRAGEQWTQTQAREAAEQMRRAAGDDCDVLILSPETDLTVLPEDEMRKLGWCRCPESPI